MSNYTAADMSTAAANGHRDGYQAGYAGAVKAVEVGKDASAQGAVAAIDPRHLELMRSGHPGNYHNCLRAVSAAKEGDVLLYAAPVAAAPVDLLESIARRMFEHQADPLAASWDRQWEPTREHWRKMAAKANAPAAPGIDLLNTAYFQGWVACAGWAGRSDLVADEGSKAYTDERDNRLHGLIDASPKGGSEHCQDRVADIEGRPRPEPEVDEVEEVAACLGDDAAAMLDENPEDERALNMQRAAELLTAMQATSAEVSK